MNKIKLSILSMAALSSVMLGSEQGIEIANSGWNVQGDIRVGWLAYDYKNPPPGNPLINKGHVNSFGIYNTAKLSIVTPTLSGFSAKITGAGATDYGINNKAYENRTFVFDPNKKDPFAILQEGYVKYESKEHKALVGRYEFDSPMISSDDYYMLANSFEIAQYTNSSLDNLTFNIGYLNKMAGVWDSGANGTEFASMSDASFVSIEDKANVKNGGIAFVSAQYDKDEHKVQVWNYYATDLYNTFFIQYDFKSGVDGFKYDVAIQAINFKEIGKLASNNYTKIDYSMFAGNVDGYFDFGLNFSTAITKITDGEGQGSTLGAWGGYSYFTGGFNFHFFEAGSLQNAALYKAQIGYDLDKIGLKNSWIGYRHVYSALDSSFSKNAKGEAQNAMNTDGVKFTYSHKSGATFSALYEQRVLDNEPNANSLRIIAGFKF